ncbi:MAG: MBL fold metallo-hydrolase [Candidatus Aenigmarchaeota archaeon ex4484_56]|nr:MAG: MBL fold metallo-hydrolase [Candidatus Aenigmarchaeota archaeon ex4484_56]
MRIFKNIYLFNGVGYSSNIYLIDNYLLIDTGLGIFFKEVIETMRASGIIPEEIKIILNTHCHYDHIGGNKKFRDLSKAEIYAHKEDAKNIETGENTIYELFGNTFHSTSVNRKLKDGDVIKTPEHFFEVIHTPGHTKGSICLYDPYNKILFSGDTLFADSIGRVDFPTGNREDMIKSLNKLKELDVTLLFPGHGIFKKGSLLPYISSLLKHF